MKGWTGQPKENWTDVPVLIIGIVVTDVMDEL